MPIHRLRRQVTCPTNCWPEAPFERGSVVLLTVLALSVGFGQPYRIFFYQGQGQRCVFVFVCVCVFFPVLLA